MSTPAAASSSQEPPIASKLEGAPEEVPPVTPAPPAGPTRETTELMDFLGQLLARASVPPSEPKIPEMPAKGHSAAPKFDDEPANLESYFTELEYQFDRCRITSPYDRKVQAVRYLDAAPRRVWRGTESYENDDHTWEDFKDQIYKLYPGSGSEQRINLSDILAFVDANAQAPYPNEKELGAYYRRLLSDTTMMIRGNRMTPREQSIIYLRGLPDLLRRQTTCRIGMKNLDRHPEDLPPIPELYDASAFCVLGGGMTVPLSSASTHNITPIAQTLPYSGASLFGLMGPTPAPIVPSAPIIPLAAPQVQPPAPAPSNQPLPFAPGLRAEEFSTLLANSIAEKMSALLAPQRSSAPRDRPPQGGNNCNFCGQANHYARNCDTAARYLNESRCKRDLQGRFVLMDGTGIRRGPDENLQQAIDRMAPVRVAAMIELVSPQVAAAAASFVNTVVTPTEVSMHADAEGDESDDEEPENQYAARCDEDLDHLSNDELQSLVHALSGQLKKTGKPAARGARAAPPKKKPTDLPPPAPAVPTVPVTPAPISTNSLPTSQAVAKVAPAKPPVPQTIVPQVRATDQKSKGKEAPGPDFHYQCPIEDKADAKKVFDRILDVSIPVTARELLSLSPDVRKQAKESTTTKKVKAAAFVGVDPVSNFLHSLDACDCHEGLIVAKESHALRSIIPIVDGCMPVECILDSGCQIVGMSRAIWMELRSQLNPKHTVSMQSANGTVDRSLGIIENLSFRFGTIELQLQVHVIEDPAYDILLGRPFDVLTESSIKNYRNEDQTITITDPNDSKRVASMQTHPRSPPRHHAQKRREGF
jgi:hypothetical protein